MQKTSDLETQHGPPMRKDGTLMKNPCGVFFKWQDTVESGVS